MMKLLAVLFATSSTFLIGTIKHTEVREVETYRHGKVLRLCADFDIQQKQHGDWVTIDSSYQCGLNWDSINLGIRNQLKDRQTKIDEARQSADERIRLESIKNDELGYSIH